MSKKKDSYMELLKKVVAEYDAGVLDVKGPMLEPIISYRGDGEMETHKDAASILERYYFREQQEIPITSIPEEQENEIKTGETPDAVAATADDLKKEIAEQEITDAEKEEAGTEAKPSDETGEAARNELEKELTTAESAILEKLIAEMEEMEEQAEENPMEQKPEEESGEAGTELASKEQISNLAGGDESDEVDKLIEQIEAELAKEEEGEEEVGAGEAEEEAGEEEVAAGAAEEEAGEAEEEAGEAEEELSTGEEDEELDLEEQAFLSELEDELEKAKEEEGGGEEAAVAAAPEGEGEEEELDIDKELEEQLVGSTPPAFPKDEEDLDEELSEAFRIFREQVEDEPEMGEAEEEEEPTPTQEKKVIV